jgi:hypothetical protein
MVETPPPASVLMISLGSTTLSATSSPPTSPAPKRMPNHVTISSLISE